MDSLKSLPAIGIHAVGAYLPDNVRDNDWWSSEIVEEWRHRRRDRSGPPAGAPDFTDGMRRALTALAEIQEDPFLGMRRRHVAAPGETSIDLEMAAVEDALARCGVDRAEIDLLLVNSSLPEDLNAPNGCLLHHRLGLAERCFTMSTAAACNAFLMHLSIAEQMIRAGQARYALLVYSALTSPILDPRMPLSCIFGDGAAAVVVGPVSAGRGLLGRAHRTDGRYHDVLKIGAPGRPWWQAGSTVMYAEDGAAGFDMLLRIPDSARQVVHEALAQAGSAPGDVDFYASHQGTAWLRRVSQEHIGLTAARSFDTFSCAGNLGPVNIPLVLANALREDLLHDGNLVSMYSGGSGITWSGVVLRWGT
jgi:3-oxoacyl-[acyl-carrier-protein] synthase-3